MREMGLEAVIRGTTVSDKATPCPLDKINRQFRAPATNMLWLSDFTYVAMQYVSIRYTERLVGAASLNQAVTEIDLHLQVWRYLKPLHRPHLGRAPAAAAARRLHHAQAP